MFQNHTVKKMKKKSGNQLHLGDGTNRVNHKKINHVWSYYWGDNENMRRRTGCDIISSAWLARRSVWFRLGPAVTHKPPLCGVLDHSCEVERCERSLVQQSNVPCFLFQVHIQSTQRHPETPVNVAGFHFPSKVNLMKHLTELAVMKL